MAEEKEVKLKVNADLSLQDVFDGYAKNATKDKPTLVDIVEIHNIKFTEDHLGNLKGSIQNVSTVAKDLYVGRGVAKVIE